LERRVFRASMIRKQVLKRSNQIMIPIQSGRTMIAKDVRSIMLSVNINRPRRATGSP
jgi:hypothetical protein